jgi:hypothetical protein
MPINLKMLACNQNFEKSLLDRWAQFGTFAACSREVANPMS